MKKAAAILLPAMMLSGLAFADVTTADDTVTKQLGANAASQITFDAGRESLTDAEISSLNDLVSQARANNEKIEGIKVFVWGDKVYSETQGSAATSEEKKVADARVKNIKKYLTKDLHVRDVETFNMTRQPGAFSDLVNAGGSKVQNMKPTQEAKAEGITPAPGGMSEFAKGNPSEALVLVYKK
jgi:hypothetical protein